MEKDGLEEERRLLTSRSRARASACTCRFAQTRMLHGQTRYNLASRFLEEIPEGLKKWLTPRFARQPRACLRSPGSSSPTRTTRTPTSRRRSGDLRQAPRGSGFRIGQNVTHPKFGAGVIVDAEGDGGDARVQVNFGRQGVKWLAVAVAKLQAA